MKRPSKWHLNYGEETWLAFSRGMTAYWNSYSVGVGGGGVGVGVGWGDDIARIQYSNIRTDIPSKMECRIRTINKT